MYEEFISASDVTPWLTPVCPEECPANIKSGLLHWEYFDKNLPTIIYSRDHDFTVPSSLISWAFTLKPRLICPSKRRVLSLVPGRSAVAALKVPIQFDHFTRNFRANVNISITAQCLPRRQDRTSTESISLKQKWAVNKTICIPLVRLS